MNELKLCFIWVEQFRNFRNVGLNFSSSCKFEYDKDSNSIFSEDISSLPNDFFGERITEVTGLIGKNGSGKSNALELLCKVLKGGYSTISGNFIIITKSNEIFTVHQSNFLDFQPQSNFEFKYTTYNGSIDPLKIIYFSNVFDQRQNNFNKEISDISNNNRYSKRLIYTTRKREKSDFEKQLDFINTNLFDDIQIEIPESILIISKGLFGSRLNTNQKHRIYLNYVKNFNDFFSDIRRRLNGIKPKTRFYYSLVLSVFQETLLNLNYISLQREPQYYLKNFLSIYDDIKNNSTEIIIREIFNWMYFLAQEQNQFQKISNYKFSSKHNFIERLEILEKIYSLLNEINIFYESEGIRNQKTELFSFKFERNSKTPFLKYFIQLNVFRNFDVNWKGISSGHKAYLNLFSLIYEEIKRIKKPNLLICIDEGDLYLHPKWQTEFFGKLLNVLPKIYSGNIQIILTSHSPFLLSDIPRQCLTILDKRNKNCSMNGIKLEKETFAGNIYDLYEAPFFLGNQKKSVFSTRKIKEVINLLENNKKTINEEELDKLISLIGDDVIRFHLYKIKNND